MNPVHVLLVDDDSVDVLGVKRAFKDARIANPIVVAHDGIDALEKLRDGASVPRPYLILLDLNMPRMSGLEFLEEIRSDASLKNSIVFVLTTSKAEEDKCRAYEHNIAGYLVKDDLGKGIIKAVDMLDAYWKVIEFP